jgi:hypothetical protein
MKTKKILILSGGGVFGYIQALLLNSVNFSVTDIESFRRTFRKNF